MTLLHEPPELRLVLSSRHDAAY